MFKLGVGEGGWGNATPMYKIALALWHVYLYIHLYNLQDAVPAAGP